MKIELGIGGAMSSELLPILCCNSNDDLRVLLATWPPNKHEEDTRDKCTWIPVLNKFDDILRNVVTTYGDVIKSGSFKGSAVSSVQR